MPLESKYINQLKQVYTLWFIILTIAWILGIPGLLVDKGTIELWINARHKPYFDFFFTYITYVGDGFLLIPIGLFLIWYKFRDACLFGFIFFIKGILTHLFKEVFFSYAPRPKEFFKDIESFYLVPGVEVYTHHSFPSGHTTSAFAIAAFFIFWLWKEYPEFSSKNNFTIHMALFGIACIVGLSRIYLFQHFYIDVYAGSVLGTFCTVFGLLAFNTIKIFRHPYLNNGLRHLQHPDKWPIAVYLIFLALLASGLFLIGLGTVHLFDWDEINFAESAREMLVTGDFWRVQINFQPFWEKPPLFFWLQAFCMHLGGVNEYMARLPNAATGILWVILAFIIGFRFRANRSGAVLALLFIGSYLPHFYFKSGIIDPVFNFFILLSLYLYYTAIKHTHIAWWLVTLAGVANGLAVITKGPVAWLVSMSVVFIFLLLDQSKRGSLWASLLVFFVCSFLVGATWFLVETVLHGTWFLSEFIAYHIRLLSTEDSGHGQPIFYYPLVLLFGMFPASFLAIPYLCKNKYSEDGFGLILWLLFWIVLVVFSLVKTKIVHYTSLCYFPIAYAAMRSVEMYSANRKAAARLKWFVTLWFIVFGLLLALWPLAMHYKLLWVDHIQDTFAKANINYQVYWPWWLGLPILFFMIIVIWAYSQAFLRWLVLILSINIMFITYVLYGYVPRVEQHVQGAAIRMYAMHADKDVYVKALGYKSYAQFYYAKKKPSDQPLANDEQWLLQGDIDKDVYIVTKTNKTNYDNFPQLELLVDTGGYKMFVRRSQLK